MAGGIAVTSMPHLLAATAACAVTALCVPWLASRAGRCGLLDVPSARSTHTRPVGRVGGLAVALGLAAGLGWTLAAGHVLLDAGRGLLPYVLPAAAFLLIGLADDRLGLRARVKFLLQGGAAALAVVLGLRWGGEGLGPFGALTFGALTPLMTWLWIVAVVVLLNLLDGIDLITSLTAVVLLGAAAGAGAGPGEGTLFLLAAAALLGFVPWNRAPARAFPGDAGAHLLGFLLAAAALQAPGRTQALPWVVASAPLLPAVLDVGLGIAAKLRRGVPFWRAHNQHLYQRLTRVGWSHAAVAVRYASLALLALVAVVGVAPRWGVWACVLFSLPILLWHLAWGHLRTHKLPHRYS